VARIVVVVVRPGPPFVSRCWLDRDLTIQFTDKLQLERKSTLNNSPNEPYITAFVMPPLAKTSMNVYSRALHPKNRGKHLLHGYVVTTTTGSAYVTSCVKSAPIAGHKWYWFHKDDTYGRTDIVDKTKIIELYRKAPTGELLHDTSLPPRSLLPNHEYEQAHACMEDYTKITRPSRQPEPAKPLSRRGRKRRKQNHTTHQRYRGKLVPAT